MSAALRITDASESPSGITLLEVLIACGLLIISLSTMAALLPAAGSQLAQAGVEDRAGILVANAMAEMRNRGLLAADAFTGSSSHSLICGKVLERMPGLPAEQLPDASMFFTAPSGEARVWSGSPRTFMLEDELLYDRPSDSDTPMNTFAEVDGAPGPRRHRDGICWAAMVTPSAPPRPGGLASLSIAVFRKEGDDDQIAALRLRKEASYYTAVDPVAAAPMLHACSWILAIPAGNDRPCRWFQIVSSWTLPAPDGSAFGDEKICLIVRNQADFEKFTGSQASDQETTILAFEGLVRVDEQEVILD